MDKILDELHDKICMTVQEMINFKIKGATLEYEEHSVRLLVYVQLQREYLRKQRKE